MTLSSKYLKLLLLALFLFTIFIRIPVLGAVGETWDEYTVVNPGETYISALKNLDFSASPWIQNYEHPPIAKYLYGLSREIPRHLAFIRGLDSEYHINKEYTVPRILSAVLGGLTVALVALIGSQLFGPIAGLISAIILATMPSFIAYTSIASLESPFIFFTTLFVYLLIRAIRSNRSRDHFLAVVVLTLSFATRYNGVFFVIFYAGVMLFRYRMALIRRQFTLIPWPVLFSPFIFLGLFFSLWPWLWLSPTHLLDSILRSSGGHAGEYFLGSLAQPNWLYYPIYFLVTTAEILLLLFGLYIFIMVRNFKIKIPNLKLIFVLAWLLTPFLATLSDFKQNGIRYIIAFVPALAVICGYSVVWFFRYLKGRLTRIIAAFILTAGLVYPLILFYPYYLDFYNLVSGSTRSAYINKDFVVGWWGEGGLAAVRFINQEAPHNSVVRINFAPEHVLIKFREDLRLERNFISGNHDDFILVNTYNEEYGDQKMLTDLGQYRLVYEAVAPAWKPFLAPLVKVYRRI